MVKTVATLKELERELQKRILDSMTEVGKIGSDTLKREVDEEVYNSYSPTTYVRTYQLKESIAEDVFQVGTFTTTRVFHDMSKITGVPRQYSNNYTGQHYRTGEYYLDDYSYFVPATVNDGTSGHIFGTGAWTKKRPYFTNTEVFMANSFKTILKGSLVRQGLKVK